MRPLITVLFYFTFLTTAFGQTIDYSPVSSKWSGKSKPLKDEQADAIRSSKFKTSRKFPGAFKNYEFGDVIVGVMERTVQSGGRSTFEEHEAYYKDLCKRAASFMSWKGSSVKKFDSTEVLVLYYLKNGIGNYTIFSNIYQKDKYLLVKIQFLEQNKQAADTAVDAIFSK